MSTPSSSAAVSQVITQPIHWASAEGITAISTVVMALSALWALRSLYLLRQQIKEDHERSRRERALELMKFYAENQHPAEHEVVFGIQLARELSDAQCRALWERQKFAVDVKERHLLHLYRSSCKSTVAREQDESPELTQEEVYKLRSITSTSLNKLEVIACAWHNNIADRDLIVREFDKIYCPKENSYVLENYRRASGIFPSIGAICDYYKEIKGRKPDGKKPTGWFGRFKKK